MGAGSRPFSITQLRIRNGSSCPEAALCVAARMGGRYRGNRQKWFAMRFSGADADINLATAHPEFDAWKWVQLEQLPELVVPFMRPLYLDVLAEFRPFWSLGPRSPKKIVAG